MKRLIVGSIVGLCGALALAAPQDAEACGGTFCDGGPNAVPVDQSGENILFVRDGSAVEAHIQIQYMGEAMNFAWVIPVKTLPEFRVGSDPFFTQLLGASVPTYGFNRTFDQCQAPDDGSNGAPDGGSAGASSTGGTSGAGDGGEGGGGPEVVFQDQVGAFEIAVLSGGTVEEVMTWLGDNGYQQDENAMPILDEYLQQGFLFAAVKLTGGAGVDQIHPIVLRFEAAQAMIPIKLTRIAATEDMDIRSFFLANNRVAPENYRHVLVNPLKIDHLNNAANYKEVIGAAVDAKMADGHAFVTEYAGVSNVVQQFGIFDPAWNPVTFQTLDPLEAAEEFQRQGLLFCDFDFGDGCTFTHPLAEGILNTYLPVPAGVDSNAFYECVSCFEQQIDLTAWDGPALAADYQSRIVDPGQNAVDLLNRFPYLTRLYTTISPGEMTEDPVFHENAELADIPNQRIGTLRTLCNGDQVYTLLDGREVYLPTPGDGSLPAWPDFDQEMPFEEEVDTVPKEGAVFVLVNNTDLINDQLAAYNQAQGWEGGSGADGGGSGGSGGLGDDGGCSCRAGAGAGGALWAMTILLGLVVARRKN